MWRILKSSISSYLVTLRYVLAFVLWTISLFVAVFVYTGWTPSAKPDYFEKTAVASAFILFCQTIGAFLLCSLRWKTATRFTLDLGTSAMVWKFKCHLKRSVREKCEVCRKTLGERRSLPVKWNWGLPWFIHWHRWTTSSSSETLPNIYSYVYIRLCILEGYVTYKYSHSARACASVSLCVFACVVVQMLLWSILGKCCNTQKHKALSCCVYVSVDMNRYDECITWQYCRGTICHIKTI